MVACSRMSESWKEEKRLSDSRLIVVKRTAKGTIKLDMAMRATGWKRKDHVADRTSGRDRQAARVAIAPDSGRHRLRPGFIDVDGRSHLHVVKHLVRHGPPNLAIRALHLSRRGSVSRAPATGLGRQPRESADPHSADRVTAPDPGGVQGNALA